MFIKYTEKNKYGGFTWELSLANLFKLQFHEANDSSIIVEFKEWKWVSNKIHFAYVSTDSLETAIKDSLDKAFNFLKNHKDFVLTKNQIETKKHSLFKEVVATLK